MPLSSNPDHEKKLSHLKNLVYVAAADGTVDKNEQLFLSQVAQKLGITAEEFNAIMAQPQKISFSPPEEESEKRAQLRELIIMMLADGSADQREVGLCVDIAVAMGLPPEIVGEITKQVIDNARKQQQIKAILSQAAEMRAGGRPAPAAKPAAPSRPAVKPAAPVQPAPQPKKISKAKLVGAAVVFLAAVGIYYLSVYRPGREVVVRAEQYVVTAEALLEMNRIDKALDGKGTISADLAQWDKWYLWSGLKKRLYAAEERIYNAEQKVEDKREYYEGRLEQFQENLVQGHQLLAQAKIVESEKACKRNTRILGGLKSWSEYPPYADIKVALETKNKALSEAITERKGFYEETMNRVIAYTGKGQYVSARRHLNQALKRHPGDKVLDGFGAVVNNIRYQSFDTADKNLKAFKKTYEAIVGPSEIFTDIGKTIARGKQANFTKQEKTALKVKDLVFGTGSKLHGFPKVKGKVMVWDYTKGNVETAYTLLTDRLRASPYDRKITIFGIRKRWDVQVGTYSISRQPALQEYMEIGVVYWPEKRCIGYSTVKGGMPPSVRTVTYVPGRGSSVSIKKWIEGHL